MAAWPQASVVRGGNFTHLGQFSTAEEAALVYARTPEARACVERLRLEAAEAMCDQLPSTAAACWEQAAAEGIELLPAHNAAGFHRVTNPNLTLTTTTTTILSTTLSTILTLTTDPDPDPNPYNAAALTLAGFHGVVIHAACRGSHRAARPTQYSSGRDEGGGKLVYRGRYSLPEQAALLYARTPSGRAEAALRLTPAAALTLAEEEGLTLERSFKNLSGYLYVNKHPTGRFQVW